MPQMGVSIAEATVLEWKKQPGETVHVGTALARIEPEGTAVQGNRERAAPPTDGDGSPPVTPVVRRMAEQHELDLSQIEGSGRRGRVTKKDVMAYLRAREEAATPAEAAPTEPPAQPILHLESPYREEEPPRAAPPPAAPPEPAAPAARELSPMRKRIAEHMVRSLRTAAHCTTIVEADMSQIEAARGRRSYL